MQITGMNLRCSLLLAECVLVRRLPCAAAGAQGLSIRLYHPESCPFDTFGYVDDDGNYASGAGLMQVDFPSISPGT